MADKLFNVGEIAELLGVSKATVNKMVKDRGMPHRKIGKLVRFNADEVLEWTDKFSRTNPTKREVRYVEAA